jgi:hypothetical protein
MSRCNFPGSAREMSSATSSCKDDGGLVSSAKDDDGGILSVEDGGRILFSRDGDGVVPVRSDSGLTSEFDIPTPESSLNDPAATLPFPYACG